MSHETICDTSTFVYLLNKFYVFSCCFAFQHLMDTRNLLKLRFALWISMNYHVTCRFVCWRLRTLIKHFEPVTKSINSETPFRNFFSSPAQRRLINQSQIPSETFAKALNAGSRTRRLKFNFICQNDELCERKGSWCWTLISLKRIWEKEKQNKKKHTKQMDGWMNDAFLYLY